MRKIYNMTGITGFVNEMAEIDNYHFTCDNIMSRYAYKKLKEFRQKENAVLVSRWLEKYGSQYDKWQIAKAFFPIKTGEIEASGRHHMATHFYYEREKFHCLILDNGEERHLKIATSSYDEKMKPYIDKMNKWLKKKLDGFHGFYAIYNETGRDYYITDRNLAPDGTYRRVASVIGSIVVDSTGSFGRVNQNTHVRLAGENSSKLMSLLFEGRGFGG